MKEYPFKAEVFTSDVSSHEMPLGGGAREYTPFVLDLLSTTFPRNPCVVDYDHDLNQPVGRAALTANENAILAEGAFVSAIDGDRAFQLGETSAGTPYGISPTLDLNDATLEYVGEGAEGVANGRAYQGPVAIYRGAKILGISICPIPTDCKTSLTVLSGGGLIQLKRTGLTLMATELEPEKKEIPTDQNNQETLGDESGVSADDAPAVRDPALQEFIDEFGLEKGVAFFQRGLTLDEAKMEDYAELKKCRLASEGENCDAPPEQEEEKKPDGFAALAAKVDLFGKKLSDLHVLLSKTGLRIGELASPRAGFAPKDAAPPKKTYADVIRDAAR